MPSTDTIKTYFIEEFDNFEYFIENLTPIQEIGFFFIIATVTLLFYSEIYYILKMHKESEVKAFDVNIEYGLSIIKYKITYYLFLVGIILIIFEFFLTKTPQIGYNNQYLHYGATISILIILITFLALSIYIYLSNPKRILRISSKWVPSWFFFLIGTFSIGGLIYKIMNNPGNSNEGNTLTVLYNILDQLFGYKLTIPEINLEIYIWYVIFIISLSMAFKMAWELTFSFRMWNEELSRVVPYAFTITTGFAVVFIYQIIFIDSLYDFFGISISLIVGIYYIKISGWCYGFSKMGKRNREKIRSDWDDALVEAVDGGKITGKKAVAICLNVANNTDSEDRAGAIRHLLEIGNEESLSIAIDALNDKSPHVRAHVAAALGEFQGKKVTELLIAMLKDDDEYVRLLVAISLGRMGDIKAIESLIATLNDNDIDVRIAAAGALGELGNESGLDLLLLAVKNKDKNVREAAVGALGAFKNEKARIALFEALQDKDKIVREEAFGVLKEMGFKIS